MKTFLFSLAIVLSFIAFLVIGQNAANKQYEATLEQVQHDRETNAYVRTIACMLSVPAVQRTSEHINNCYNKAEASEKVKIDRYIGETK